MPFLFFSANNEMCNRERDHQTYFVASVSNVAFVRFQADPHATISFKDNRQVIAVSQIEQIISAIYVC